MPNLRELRFKLRIAAAVLGLLCLALTGLLVFMSTGSARQDVAFRSLHSQVRNSKAAMVPPQTVEDRVKEAREQIAQFYENRFPATASSIFVQLGRLADENHVRLNQAAYKTEDSELPGIQQVTINANLGGNYEQAMKFINALERDKMFFIVNGVSLGDQNGGNVRLNINLQTYMKGGAQ
ncbi:MAG: hypothetical protein ACXVZX_02730 [Terriglobales bacterium]